MEVTVLGAFLAGLISFLSPCVLPLVPGYVSMLSGIGVEQLKQDEAPRASLLASSLAFVVCFSVVFIAFGASASAVGQFLVRNKGLLAPVAGAIVVIFGLHLIGWLGKIPVIPGLAIGGVLVAVGVAMKFWQTLSSGAVQPVHLFSVALIFLFGPYLAKVFNRDVHIRNVEARRGL